MTSINSKLARFFKLAKQQLKLHWLDLIVIAIVIVIGAVLLWQRAQRKTEWINVQVKISQEEWWWRGEGPEAWYAQGLKTGDWGFNSFGEKVSQLEKLQIVDTGAGRNQIVIWAKLKVSYNPKQDQYIFGFQPLQVGRGIELNLGKQQIKGLVVAIGQADVKPVEKLVKLRVAAMDPLVADNFSEGLMAKTLAGEPIATIVKLKTFPTSETHYSDIRNQIVMVTNPQFKTVELVVRLRLYQIGDQYLYVDGTPIKIGATITLQFPQVVLPWAQVISWEN